MTETAAPTDLLTIVVQRKEGPRVLDVLKKNGAPGMTFFYGQGAGVREKLGFWGHFIEAEKMIVMTAAPPELTDVLWQAVFQELRLDKPGRGLMFVQKLDRVAGHV